MIKSKKKIIGVLIAFVLLFTALIACVGCAEEEKDKKYDVAIKVANNYG